MSSQITTSQAYDNKQEEWTSVIKPPSGWMDVNLSDLWQYRDLIVLFVKRDIVAIYKQTIFGPLWHLFKPLLTTLTFYIVFGRIAQLPTDGISPLLFYMSGIICWSYFADCLMKTSDTFIANSEIFGKVYFPRLVIPISMILSSLISFGIQFLMFLLIWAFYLFTAGTFAPNLAVLLLPVLLIIMAAFSLGAGIMISSMTTKYRDLKFLLQFGVQLFMYLTPVIYPLSSIPEGKLRMLYMANPMATVIEVFRYAFLGTGTFSMASIGSALIISFVFLAGGILVFSRVEKSFMDTV